MSPKLRKLQEYKARLNSEQVLLPQNTNLNALETLKLIELLFLSSDKVYSTTQIKSLIKNGINNEEKNMNSTLLSS